MLQVASHLVGQPDWAEKQAMVQLRRQGGDGFRFSLLGGDSPKSLADVLDGRIDVAIVNPATAASAGLHHAGFDLDALAAIATVPSYDQLGIAVHADAGVTRLEELAEVRPPLRLALRPQQDHAVQGFIRDALAAVGVTLDDIVDWGGALVPDASLPREPSSVLSGDANAVADEGVYNWGSLVLQRGMQFLSFGEETLAVLESWGYRRGLLTPHRFPELKAAVPTLDFSGFLLYTRADASDNLVENFCAALFAERENIAWQGGSSLPLEHMAIDAMDAPLAVPLHPAAARFWTAHGLIGDTGD
jgi:hypothetical protein